ncbi:phage tail protein I [Actinoplanes solisilvae]|uniref:phage tail protein I n=1 Tax=Actinoplanes solisilvae TaxID=2486853 RepID=UPI000FD718AC|nr:phage tail protein I [Actinoplanes solisilvae]
MNGDRGLSLLAHPDQWARCSHDGTALVPGGGVQLTWADDDNDETRRPRLLAGRCVPPTPPVRVPEEPAGLAFDRWCRSYRSNPAQHRVDVATAAGDPRTPAHQPGILRRPLGLAVDRAQRLYVVEHGAAVVHVVDLWAQRLLRRVPVRSAAHRARRPVDVAALCCRAYVLLQRPAALVVITGRRGPLPGPPLHRPRGRGPLEPTRIAAHRCGLYVLWRRPGTPLGLIARPDGTVEAEVDGATDIDLTADGTLIVARAPHRPFRRFQPAVPGRPELEPLDAPRYDGGALSVAPNGRIAYTAAGGHAWTAGPSARHTTTGTVTTYRLDSGAYATRWGRLFLDACLPPGTTVTVRFLTTDEDDVTDPLPWRPADRGHHSRRDHTPTLPSRTLLDEPPTTPPATLVRRPTGREWPWAQIAADDRFETYETPVAAPPGRYLWLVLHLSGTHRTTPRVRALRVERPGHQLLRRLPRSWSRDETAASFLQRYLAPAEALLHEMDERSAQRAVLVDPHTCPQETLNWLAGFAGLVLDRRWPEPARRTLIAEAYPLFRRRGTIAALERIIAVYLGVAPVIVERWRLRGIGGAVLGTQPGGPPAPAIEGAARATGTLGRFTLGGSRPGDDVYKTSAHQFSVLIPAELSTEQLQVVRGIVDTHKPAHTTYDICELGSGMRIGRRLHLSLTSFVGPGAAAGPAVVGQVLVGGDGVVGLPAVGARLGQSSRPGELRVG